MLQEIEAFFYFGRDPKRVWLSFQIFLIPIKNRSQKGFSLRSITQSSIQKSYTASNSSIIIRTKMIFIKYNRCL